MFCCCCCCCAGGLFVLFFSFVLCVVWFFSFFVVCFFVFETQSMNVVYEDGENLGGAERGEKKRNQNAVYEKQKCK